LIVIPTAMNAPVTRNLDNPIAIQIAGALSAAHPWGTLGKPEDVARAALFLVSEDAQWITGVPLLVDGGYCLA
jgi:NAD(P)-dependent dehydrogenase (short-subunit alcohol dehydrogenase family)